MITLTGEMIVQLARFAGLECKAPEGEEEILETEYTLAGCVGPVLLEDADEGKQLQFNAAVYCSEYPEEGVFGLGQPVEVGRRDGKQIPEDSQTKGKL